MRINFLHICDHALVDQRGKLSVLGIFGIVNTSVLPATNPQFFLAFQTEAGTDDNGKVYPLTIRFTAPNERVILKIDGHIAAPNNIAPGRPAFGSHAMRVPLLTFEQPGKYSVSVAVGDGEPLIRWIDVVLPDATTQAATDQTK